MLCIWLLMLSCQPCAAHIVVQEGEGRFERLGSKGTWLLCPPHLACGHQGDSPTKGCIDWPGSLRRWAGSGVWPRLAPGRGGCSSGEGWDGIAGSIHYQHSVPLLCAHMCRPPGTSKPLHHCTENSQTGCLLSIHP